MSAKVRGPWRPCLWISVAASKVNETAIVNYIMNQLVQIPNRQDRNLWMTQVPGSGSCFVSFVNGLNGLEVYSREIQGNIFFDLGRRSILVSYFVKLLHAKFAGGSLNMLEKKMGMVAHFAKWIFQPLRQGFEGTSNSSLDWPGHIPIWINACSSQGLILIPDSF